MSARAVRSVKKVKIPKAKKPRKKKVYSYDGYIIAALRRIWRYHPDRKKAKDLAKNEDGTSTCYVCNLRFEEVQIDHKDPVGPCKFPDGKRDYNLMITRMLDCGVDNLAAICKTCHTIKTTKERAERAKAKKLAK